MIHPSDPSIGVEDHQNMTGEQDEDDSSSGDSDGEDGARSQNFDPGTPQEHPREHPPGAQLRRLTPPHPCYFA